jgi:hypothetical protein
MEGRIYSGRSTAGRALADDTRVRYAVRPIRGRAWRTTAVFSRGEMFFGRSTAGFADAWAGAYAWESGPAATQYAMTAAYAAGRPYYGRPTAGQAVHPTAARLRLVRECDRPEATPEERRRCEEEIRRAA